MTEMEIALLFALVRVLDGFYTPLNHRIKCWKIRGAEFFILGMTNPQFTGPDDILDWLIPMKYYDKFDVIEYHPSEAPRTIDNITQKVIERLYKI